MTSPPNPTEGLLPAPGGGAPSELAAFAQRAMWACGAFVVGVAVIYVAAAIGTQIGRPWLGVVGLAIDVLVLAAYFGWLNYRHDPLASTLGPLVALLVVILFFSVTDLWQNGSRYSYWTVNNLRTVAVQTAPIAVAALGMTVIIISGGIDLSAGVAIALCATVLARCLDDGYDWSQAHGISLGWLVLFALAASVLAGTLTGTVNGSLISGLGVAPFIVTLGTMTIVLGIANMLANETTVRPPPEAVPVWLKAMVETLPEPTWIGPSFWSGIPEVLPNFGWGVWLAVLLAGLLGLVLDYTVFGRHVFALGSNEATARLCGIPVAATKIAIYALGGFFLGIAGIFQFALLSSGTPTSGRGLELKVIAAVVIGGGSLSGGRGSVFGACCGAALMYAIDSGCVALRLANPIQDILIGVIIIVAVCIDRIREGKLSLDWLDWTWRWAVREPVKPS